VLKDEIDPRFTQAAGAAKRRRRAARRRGVLVALAALLPLLLIGVGLWLTWDKWTFGSPGKVAKGDLEETIVVASEEDTAAASSAFVAAFADLAGDPLIIRFSEDGAKATHEIRPSAGIDRRRIPTGKLLLVDDVMVSAEARFVTTLPSSQEDFAFFQMQKRGAAANDEPIAAEDVDEEGVARRAGELAEVAEAAGEREDEALTEETGGWGEAIGVQEEEGGEYGFTETVIENTTSVALVRPQDLREKLDRDIFVKIKHERGLEDLLADNNFFEAEAKVVAEAAKAHFALEKLAVGMVVAMRGQPQLGSRLSFRQLSLYDKEEYFGTLSLTDEGDIGPGSDPWFEDELFDYAEGQEEEVVTEQRYRMLDAFYSAAIRNGIPSVVVGEAIALLSKEHDLDAFANPGDRMRLLYAPEPTGGGGEDGMSGQGRILYISIRGEAVDIECFVYTKNPQGEFGCFGLKPKAGAGGGFASGMTTPVKGVLTSRFGPRHHPILKKVIVHSGVDWAAPTGTPVYAAFDGKVAYAGSGGGYGNLLKIAHAGGMETRYAHLTKFATKQGASVRAGELVGYVGTTGRSTGPHLHFELRIGGQAVDPFTAVAPGSGAVASGPASGAVEQLVNKIIKVESGGNASAKNPLSTATGLGQFIESTWVRMMKTYRPDLYSSLSRGDLLALRNDPTISREMVKNLAREGESYLRARGHGITAGRLYLCHFLGAQGAAVVLSASDQAMLVDVLGVGVIKANPFLTGKNVAYVKSWAEKKMSGHRGGSVVVNAPVVREPKGLPPYRKEIQQMLRQI